MPFITTDIAHCASRLAQGQLVAIPTETVYGLAADARNPAAVQRVFDLKGRPSTNPLIVHLHDMNHVDEWASQVPDAAQRLMHACWPGPLTLVLPARASVSRSVTAGQDSVALRVPAHPVALALLKAFAGGLVAPSANRYMSISPTTASHVAQQFARSDLHILDGGPCQVGLESTIVSLLPGEAPRLLREGMLGVGDLEQILGCELLIGSPGNLRVPGQHLRHYAPGTPASGFKQLNRDALNNPLHGWLWCEKPVPSAGPAIELGDDPQQYAAGLYAALYKLDGLGLNHLHIQLPPPGPAWAAIHDRLARACHSSG